MVVRTRQAPAPIIIGGEHDAAIELMEARRVLVVGDRIVALHDVAPYLTVFDFRMVCSRGAP